VTPNELENKCNEMYQKLNAYRRVRGMIPIQMKRITNGQVLFVDMMTAEQYVVYLTADKEPTWGILH
jgi:hypothetical protein